MEEKMLALFQEICDTDEVLEQRDVDLMDAGLMDSMAFIDLLVGIEDEFGVVIAPTEFPRDQVNTVNKIIDIVRERM